MTEDLKYFFKEASKSVRAYEAFLKKNKKLLEEHEKLERTALGNKFVVSNLAREDFAKDLKRKKTIVVLEDKTIEVRVGKNKAEVFNKSIYKN
jgi:uncharacterized protein (DUF2461 family)